MVDEVYTSGETIEIAKEKACDMLGVTEKDLEIEVLQMPSKKLLGMFGGKIAQIKASIRKPISQKAVEFLKETLYYMGLKDLKVEITSDEPDCCEIKITGDDVGYVIGRHGDTLDSLQYITALIANSGNKGRFCKIHIAAANYRENHSQVLVSMAKYYVDQVLKTGKTYKLYPMRSYERKIVHSAIGKIDGIKAWSEGDGTCRSVVISPVINTNNESVIVGKDREYDIFETEDA